MRGCFHEACPASHDLSRLSGLKWCGPSVWIFALCICIAYKSRRKMHVSVCGALSRVARSSVIPNEWLVGWHMLLCHASKAVFPRSCQITLIKFLPFGFTGCFSQGRKTPVMLHYCDYDTVSESSELKWQMLCGWNPKDGNQTVLAGLDCHYTDFPTWSLNGPLSVMWNLAHPSRMSVRSLSG